MKRFIGLILAFAVLCVPLTLNSCSRKKTQENSDLSDGKNRLGLGIYSYYDATVNASDDSDGVGNAEQTAAAVFFGGDGKIVACRLDCAESPMHFTYDGKYAPYGDFETKREMGNAYGMKAAGAKLEWFEQADVFEKLCVGKTLDEVAHLAADGKSTDEVINAGCTIDVSDFIRAVEAAAGSAKVTDASHDDVLKLAVSTAADGSDASAENDGRSGVESTFAAMLVNGDGKVTDCRIDCVDAEITFAADGTASTPNGEIISKRSAGYSYGMKNAGAKLEWFEQADVFEKACTGKTLAGILLLDDNGYGNEEVQKSGCTVKTGGMVKAASKALNDE